MSLVSLVKYEDSPSSVVKAIDLCDGFSELKSDSVVVLKPNIVAWQKIFPIAPFGVYTSTRVMEDIIIALKDFGVKKIIVAEGSVVINPEEGTMQGFEGLGYFELKKRYGIELVDLNASKGKKFEFDSGHLYIAEEAIDNDFFIDVPVLKTHAQAKVSLGMKNLKGCLKDASRKFCHDPRNDLEYSFSFVADFIKPDLTIIDGIYALEKGALHFGKAHRKDIIVASKDILAADMVAAQSVGYGPTEIDHFKHYAKRHNKSISLDDYEIKGENLQDHIKKLEWDWPWNEENTGPPLFDKYGIKGPAVPKADNTLCSGCSPVVNLSNVLVMSAFKGEPLPKVEILHGKQMLGRTGYDKTILLGNCIIKANENNPNIKEALPVKGCPPAQEDVIQAMKDAGLDVNELVYVGYLKKQSEKYDNKEGYDKSLYFA